MTFDFNKVKQRIFGKGVKSSAQNTAAAEQPIQQETAKKAAGGGLANFQQGLNDIKAVLAEGKIKLFAKQIVLLLLVFLGVKFVSKNLIEQRAQLTDKISALSIQQENEEDYLANKEQLLRLEPLFPDMGKKNDWLLRKIMDVFETHQLKAHIDGNVSEKTTDTYTVVAQPVTFQQSFNEAGKFFADIENGDDFLRVSELTINKITDPALLGKNDIKVRFNTLFPKEKYGPRLFKDYNQRMKQLTQENTADETTSEEKEATL